MSRLTVDLWQCKLTGLIKLKARGGPAWARCAHWSRELPAETDVEWNDACVDLEFADEKGFDRFSTFGKFSKDVTQ